MKSKVTALKYHYLATPNDLIDLKQEVRHLFLQVKFSWNTAMATHLLVHFVCGGFPITTAEISSCCREDQMAHGV